MDKNKSSNPWGICTNGDCPDLDNGPKSREHEGRFVQRAKSGGQMTKNDAAVAQNIASTQNQAK